MIMGREDPIEFYIELNEFIIKFKFIFSWEDS